MSTVFDMKAEEVIITCLTLFLRAFEDEKKAKMGVVECAKHGLLEPFNVLWEKEGMFCRF